MSKLLERIHLLMNEKNIKIDKDLVSLGLISKNSLRNWETGSKPRKASILALAAYFGVSAEYLLGETDDRGQTEKAFVIDTDKLNTALTLPVVIGNYVNACNSESQLRILQFVMDEYEHNQAERKTS